MNINRSATRLPSFFEFLTEANAAGSKFEQKTATAINKWLKHNHLDSKFAASRYQTIHEDDSDEHNARDEEYSDVVIKNLETDEQIFVECKQSIRDNIITTQFDISQDFDLIPVESIARTPIEDELTKQLAADLQQTTGFQEFVRFLQEQVSVAGNSFVPADLYFGAHEVNSKELQELIKKYNAMIKAGETESDNKPFSSKLIRETTRNMLALGLLWRISDKSHTWDICCAEELPYFGELIRNHYLEGKAEPAKYAQFGDNLFVFDASANPLGIKCDELPTNLKGKFYLKFTPRFGTGSMYITPRSSITDSLESSTSFISKDRWPEIV